MPPPSRALPRPASTTSQLPDSGYTSTCSLLASDGSCPSLLRTAGSSTLLGARNCNTGGEHRGYMAGTSRHSGFGLPPLPADPRSWVAHRTLPVPSPRRHASHRPGWPRPFCGPAQPGAPPCRAATQRGPAAHVVKHGPGRGAPGNDGFCRPPQVLREGSEHRGVDHRRQLVVPWGERKAEIATTRPLGTASARSSAWRGLARQLWRPGEGQQEKPRLRPAGSGPEMGPGAAAASGERHGARSPALSRCTWPGPL